MVMMVMMVMMMMMTMLMVMMMMARVAPQPLSLLSWTESSTMFFCGWKKARI